MIFKRIKTVVFIFLIWMAPLQFWVIVFSGEPWFSWEMLIAGEGLLAITFPAILTYGALDVLFWFLGWILVGDDVEDYHRKTIEHIKGIVF